MLDKISGLFRRSSKPAASAAGKPVQQRTATVIPPVDPVAVDAARAEEARRLLAGSPSSADVLRIARDTLPADIRCLALARMDAHSESAALLREIALHDRIARVRLAAAERLSAAEDLELLRRDSSDKAVQRHVRDALKTLRDAEKSAQETRTRIAHLLTSIAQHAARSFEPLYDAKLDSLESAWLAVAAHASAADQERFAELSALARDTVNRHAAEISARAQAIAAKQELIAACSELETVVRQLREEDLSSQLAAVSALCATQETRWNEAASLGSVDAPLEKRYRAALASLNNWLTSASELPRVAQDASALLTAIAANAEPDHEQLDDWLHTLDALQARCHWPETFLQPALIAELASTRRHLRNLEKAHQLDRQQQLAQLRKRRHGLKRMIDEGQLRAATRSMTWLRKRIDTLPAADAASEAGALEPLAEALQRLHDWYEFASVPKKTELCERIESLAATVAPNSNSIAERAERVRELREQWNMLCAADPDADPELRARFNTAADIAYAPCAAWYAEQHRIQDENLARRSALCDELAARMSALTGGDASNVTADATAGTDWKALEKQERDARATWKTIEPVRWPDARATQERFTQLIGDMRALLEKERQASAARRDALITEAVALQTREPLDTAINAAKKLQDAWKNTGYSDPREDRRQWQAFRAALDAVFARRDSARNAEREAREAAQAEALRVQAEQARLQAEELERKRQREEQKREARRTEIAGAQTLAALEAQWLAGDNVDTQALAAQLDALPASPLTTALKARIERINNDQRPTPEELATRGEELALLTLDLEIAHDLPSPPALSALRMQRKVDRLNAALRGNKDGKPADKNKSAGGTLSALDTWLAIGPLPGTERSALHARIASLL